MNKKSLSANRKIHSHILQFLDNKKIFKIYSNFIKQINIYTKTKKLAVAISGGPDSIALAFFAKCYSLKKNIKCYFFLVDHGLRKESHIEAKHVVLKLKKYNISCKIIKWIGKKTFIQIYHPLCKNLIVIIQILKPVVKN
jgi:Predicted ATPase of the PP-loop superfamily implicated in cell cycle control